MDNKTGPATNSDNPEADSPGPTDFSSLNDWKNIADTPVRQSAQTEALINDFLDDETAPQRPAKRSSNPQAQAWRVRDRNKLSNQHKVAMREAQVPKDQWAAERHRERGPVTDQQIQAAQAIHEVKMAEAARHTKESTVESPELPQLRAEKIFNSYKNKFNRNIAGNRQQLESDHTNRAQEKLLSKNNPVFTYLPFGVTSALEQGMLNVSPAAMLHRGFWSREESKIHQDLDPTNTYSDEVIAAEGPLKARLASEVLDPQAADISEIELRAAKYQGTLRAALTGARVDERTHDVVYSLPTTKSSELRDFMTEAGVDFEKDDRLRVVSHQGFANIINTIKRDESATEQGFAALDWYFENFNYTQHMEEFLTDMDEFQEAFDGAWVAKYEEYMSHRNERDEFLKQQERKTEVILEDIEEITEDDLVAEYGTAEEVTPEGLLSEYGKLTQEELIAMDQAVGLAPISPTEPRLFPDTERFHVHNPGKASTPSSGTSPSSHERYGALVSEYQRIKTTIDPDITVYKSVFANSKGEKIPFRVIRFGFRNSNVAVAVPIAHRTINASYVWIGQTGADREGWRVPFQFNPDPNTRTSMYQARQRNDVRAHNHAASAKRGLNKTENMWRNIWQDIGQRAV